jgi:hypothetical protein
MLMVEHALRGRPAPPFDRMSVVEADQALAMRSMQRQRIIEAVRLGLANRDALDDEPDPMPSLWIDDKNLPVQVKQGVKGWIALHRLSLSENDKRITNNLSA